jgi:hypothetical protein
MNTKKKRCPNGTRRDKYTKHCKKKIEHHQETKKIQIMNIPKEDIYMVGDQQLFKFHAPMEHKNYRDFSTNLSKNSVVQLKSLCKTIGIKYSGMKKGELLSALQPMIIFETI